jgi:O-antigen ligase
MAMVILSEKRPYEAVGVVLRRLAFLMLPLSVLFVKYYPDLGRWYRHDGAQTFIGIGTQKNDLGLMCLLAGIYMGWELLQRRRSAIPSYIQEHRTLTVLMAGMLGWLLYKSNSQTSLACLIAAVGVLMLGRPAFMTAKPNRIFAVLCIGGLSMWLLDDALELKETVLYLLGREPHLTTRTDVWEIVLGFNTNPIYGVGFMSFWTGARLEEVWKQLGVQLNQAHNGYLEQYLNLGYIGVGFIGIIMMSALHKARRNMAVDPAAGVMRLSFVVVAGLYNYTEASFYGSNNMWMLLLLAYLEAPRQTRRRTVDKKKPRQQMVQARAKALASTYSR